VPQIMGWVTGALAWCTGLGIRGQREAVGEDRRLRLDPGTTGRATFGAEGGADGGRAAGSVDVFEST